MLIVKLVVLGKWQCGQESSYFFIIFQRANSRTAYRANKLGNEVGVRLSEDVLGSTWPFLAENCGEYQTPPQHTGQRSYLGAVLKHGRHLQPGLNSSCGIHG